MSGNIDIVKSRVSQCKICAVRFAATKTAHVPRPIVWFARDPRILIIGQAPGMRVYNSGKPFTDPSGDRLREWLGIADDVFYDRKVVSILPMAFCFPGYDAKGADLPPPGICAQTWHAEIMDGFDQIPLTVLVGGYSQKWYLKSNSRVTDIVRTWRDHAPMVFPLPHPSWRNTGWINRNPWFSSELLPSLQARVKEVLE